METNTYEYNVVVKGRKRCDDWTDMDEALDQAAAFLGLGVGAVTIECRRKYRGDADLGEFLAAASSGALGS